MDTDNIAIEVSGLSKSFGDVRAVNKINFNVYKGEIFGFLGPNGAGKTTTINMLIGLARPDEGFIYINGIDCSSKPKDAQQLMGIVPDESNLYPELTGYENLTFCGALYGMKARDRETRARKLLELFGLNEAANRRFSKYSKGMKRKLTIAAGIIHSPSILFLDEPTTGIDVASARHIRQIISGLNTTGTTIFLTTHYIEEAERLCQRIAFIVSGRIVRIDTLSNLMRQIEGRNIVQFSVSRNVAVLPKVIESNFQDIRCQTFSGTTIRVESKKPVQIGPLVHLIEDNGIEVYEARKIQPSLEDVFVEITGIESAVMKNEKEKMETGK
jgi:ABC-2 type transport system ATP-binding protein